MQRLLTLYILVLFGIQGYSQELNCNFSVNHSRLQGTNKQVFTTLEEAVRDFLNNTVWTNHVYEAQERIECNILLDILEPVSADKYKAKLQIQARRPVFGTSYNTVLFNYIDNDVQFKYQEFDPINYSENSFLSNLSSVLSYYAYFIIGLDYDSFSPQGGTQYFQKAEKIVDNAQGSGYTGWRGGDSRQRKNRYWLIENMLDPDYRPIRDFNYSFHRLGMDVMEKSVEQGRNEIFKSIEELKRFHDNKPDPFLGLLQVFIDSKSDEIVNIFEQAPADKKQKVLSVMLQINPGGGNKYEGLRK